MWPLLVVSISSPSSEGGGLIVEELIGRFLPPVSISSPSSEGGGLEDLVKNNWHVKSFH